MRPRLYVDSNIGRREFLRAACAGSVFAGPFERAAAAQRKKVKITGVKCMIVRGTWDWNLIKIETDSGLYGIGEAYWGWGVKDLVLNKLAPIIVGEDPLNVDKLCTKMLMRSAGAGAIAGVTVTAASGIEIALWDLAGRILDTPVCNLLGGRFRDKVRFYRTNSRTAARVEDMQSWKDQVAGGPDAARQDRGYGARHPRRQRAHLHGREPVYAPGFPAADRAAGDFGRAHRYSEVGRIARSEAHLGSGGDVLHLDRGA